MVKNFTKAILEKLFPDLYLELMSRRARAYSQVLERKYGCTEITHRLIERQGPVVSNGPFKGLEFPSSIFHRHISPKLIGAYEQELHHAFEEVIKHDYQEVLDVGCAEGYYAIGLAQHFPRIFVHAFDTDAWARRVVREMAELNDVNNVIVHGKCDVKWLANYLKLGSFLLCDCEGYEDVLLQPDLVPALRQCDILVELHEKSVAGVSARMKDRFKSTHVITLIRTEPRFPEQYENLAFLSEKDQELAVNELRNGEEQEWLYLRRRK